jgi:hypothetical protein
MRSTEWLPVSRRPILNSRSRLVPKLQLGNAIVGEAPLRQATLENHGSTLQWTRGSRGCWPLPRPPCGQPAAGDVAPLHSGTSAFPSWSLGTRPTRTSALLLTVDALTCVCGGSPQTARGSRAPPIANCAARHSLPSTVFEKEPDFELSFPKSSAASLGTRIR